MKAILTTLAIGGLLCCASTRAEDSPDRVSLFQVPLQCPSAPEIGCGSKAKRILAALEASPVIAEAWLNQAGTSLAVVGGENSTPETRAKAVQTILEKRNVKATALAGVAGDTAFKDFAARTGWYRGAELNQLSEQESGIIAARLVRRLQAEVSLSEEKARALEAAFTDAFKRHYTRDLDKPDQTPLDLLKPAREHLDEKSIAALKDTIASGLRPLPNEK